MRRVRRNDLADHHPIKQHTQGGQALLYGRLGVKPELGLNKRRHMHRLDLGEIRYADLDTEAGELTYGFHVGATGIWVADVRGEEIPHARTSLW